MKGGSPSGEGVASAVLALAALPFAAVLALALREAHVGLTADQIVVFYVVPACWLVGTAVALRSGPAVRAHLALTLVSIGLTVGVAELGLGAWARATARTPSGASILDEVLALRTAGHAAYPKIPGNVLVDWNTTLTDGARSWHPVTPAPGSGTVVLCNENGPVVTYEADRFGFDNPDDVWDGGSPDVAVIGDSYTAGVCVERDETIPARLRASFSLIDLGTSGAGPLQELAILREYVAPLRPRTVLWIYYEGNDLWDLARERERPWLTAYLDAGHTQALRSVQDVLDARYRAWIDSLVVSESVAAGAAAPAPRTTLLGDALRMRALRSVAGFGVPFPERDSTLGLLPSALTRARDDVAAWGGRLVVAYMPAYARYATSIGEGVEGRRELLAFAHESGIPVIDLHEAFAAHPDPRSLWMAPQAHLSPEGYALAAEAIAPALRASP